LFLSVQEILVQHIIYCLSATHIREFFFSQNVQTGAEPPSHLLKGHRDICLWCQVVSVQLSTCFQVVSKLQKNGAVPHFPTHLHDVQNDFTCKFKFDIGEETSLGQVFVTVSEYNANRKVPASFSKTIMCRCSWK